MFFLSIITIIVILIFYINYNDNHYFEIEKYPFSFYIIPEDKGGKKIDNLDKSILHLNSSNNINLFDENNIDYSIQLFASPDLNKVRNKMNFYLNKKIYNKNDFFIVVFNNSLNTQYLLIYKNFVTRILAYDYCNKYINFIDNCLIVNVKNIN